MNSSKATEIKQSLRGILCFLLPLLILNHKLLLFILKYLLSGT
ncbi:hypothetical protein HanIR_Chr03g0101591 [Helianthus annuus]|nr:hypothetical protein HanIR_Chr03g0101591 [Helianthus annuus]